MLGQYRKCAATCEQTDYGDEKSVRAHNRAVDRMYSIVRQAVAEGPDAVGAYYPLLYEPVPARWLAHHLIELAELPLDMENSCFAIVEARAKGDGPEAMGERIWLKEWRQKRGRI